MYQILTILAAACGTAGSILTAYSVSGLIRELVLARRFNSLSIEAIAKYVAGTTRDIPLFKGLNENHKKAEKKGNVKLWIGVMLLAVGFILQTVSMISSSNARCYPVIPEYSDTMGSQTD